MKQFLTVVVIGAALAAGVISVFQNAPFLVFVRRVGLTLVGFYAVGAALTLLWNTAATFTVVQHRTTVKKGTEEGADGIDDGAP